MGHLQKLVLFSHLVMSDEGLPYVVRTSSSHSARPLAVAEPVDGTKAVLGAVAEPAGKRLRSDSCGTQRPTTL